MDAALPMIAGILCSGKSRRMGLDKAGLVLPDGRTLLERTCEVAERAAGKVVLLGRPAAVPDSLNHLEIVDDLQPGLGPLGGLQSALHALPNSSILLLACDLPRLESTLVDLLLAEPLGADHAAVFESPGDATRLEPCCALYSPSIRPRVDQAVAEGTLSLRALLASGPVRRIPVPPHLSSCLANINTPDEFEALRQDRPEEM